MKKVLYTLALLFALTIICYGVLGIIGTSVSYKFEIEDPTVEINIRNLDPVDQKIAYIRLTDRKKQLRMQEVKLSVLTIIGIITFILLIVKRKQIFR
ncbi:MAG: hypothetical protein BGO87_01365 [Flavobacteriia bacterium 40-80]|nr:MAG: hypothetical protein BGO87_01365 [Flavobacteriia bacterium 40-80]